MLLLQLNRRFNKFFYFLPFLLCLLTNPVFADRITTQEAFAQYDRAALTQLINSEQARAQMLDMGIDPNHIEERLSTLTDAELAKFNQQLEKAPAGGSVAGVALTVFIVFIITDMLCATDIFGFVNCVN